MKNKMKFVPLLILLVVISLNIGYAVFGESLLISDITAQVRLQENVRVTGIVSSGSTSDGLSNSEDYNVKRIAMNLSLPNPDSTVTYTVSVTNFGNKEMGIAAITGLPENLDYDISPNVLGEMVCDVHGKCTLGAVKEFTITIKYGTYDSSNTTFDLYLDFEFRGYYNVTYINAPRGNNYKTKAMANVEFQQTGVPAGGGVITYTNSGTKISGASYNLTNKFFTVPSDKVTEDITVTFRPLGEYINKLYADGTKSTVKNGTISYTYNRVTDQNLINDRLGGTASSADGGDVRYYGTGAKNYIYYNCKNYDDKSTCEKWRIIGVFNNKVKIINTSSIGSYPIDPSINKWEETSIKKLLNPGYESQNIGGSLYWNAKSGTCYTGRNSATSSCDFTSRGLQNNDTRDFVTTETISFTSARLATNSISHIYQNEHGSGSIYSGNPKTWTGKVSLIYSSDYYYSADLSSCNVEVYFLTSICGNTSWMKQSSGIWTVTPGQSGAGNEWYIRSSSAANYDDVYNKYLILPTMYLKTNTIFIDGDGTNSSPYRLYPNADNY